MCNGVRGHIDVTICWQVWTGTSEEIAVPTSKGCHNAGLREQQLRLLGSSYAALCHWSVGRTSVTFYYHQRGNISSHYHFDTVLYVDPEHSSPLHSILKEPYGPRGTNKFLHRITAQELLGVCVLEVSVCVLLHSVSEGHLELADWHVNAIQVNQRLWPVILCSRGGQTYWTMEPHDNFQKCPINGSKELHVACEAQFGHFWYTYIALTLTGCIKSYIIVPLKILLDFNAKVGREWEFTWN
jgi:hypothetical protein